MTDKEKRGNYEYVADIINDTPGLRIQLFKRIEEKEQKDDE